MQSNQDDKAMSEVVRLEDAEQSVHNLVYDDAEQEPELHLRTYVAVAAMFLLNFVQVFALTGPPVVVGCPGALDLHTGADCHSLSSATLVGT